MPPKNKKQAGGGSSWTLPKSVVNAEHYHTLNHLHQVGAYWASVSASSSTQAKVPVGDGVGVGAGDLMDKISKKAVMRLDVGVKRGCCRACGVVLVPGLTARVRVRGSKPHGMVMDTTCTRCKSKRRIPVPPETVRPRPFADRVEGEGTPTPRGDHVIVHGLGKGGVVNPP